MTDLYTTVTLMEGAREYLTFALTNAGVDPTPYVLELAIASEVFGATEPTWHEAEWIEDEDTAGKWYARILLDAGAVDDAPAGAVVIEPGNYKVVSRYEDDPEIVTRTLCLLKVLKLQPTG